MASNNYRLKIVDYFSSCINTIDLRVEIYLKQHDKDSEKDLAKVNNLRNECLHEIKEIERFNLKNLETVELSELKRCEMDPEKINKLIFKNFCFIISQEDLANLKLRSDASVFGYLFLVDGYLAKQEIFYFISLLNDCGNHKCYLSFDNIYFQFENQQVTHNS